MKTRLIKTLLPVWVVLISTGSLFAQEAGRLPKQDKGILQWVIAIVLTILIVFPGFMNPKRTHLD
jgi:hypothetical protein